MLWIRIDFDADPNPVPELEISGFNGQNLLKF